MRNLSTIALANPSPKISQAYADIQNALVETVSRVHCNSSAINPYRDAIANFLKNFAAIITFNYDITIYWVMLYANSNWGTWFKDCFVGPSHTFDVNWPRLRAPYKGAAGEVASATEVTTVRRPPQTHRRTS